MNHQSLSLTLSLRQRLPQVGGYMVAAIVGVSLSVTADATLAQTAPATIPPITPADLQPTPAAAPPAVNPTPQRTTPPQSQPAPSTEKKPEPKDQPDEFPPNPLEITTPDPLLPNPPIKRPLSPLERRNLEAALDQLNVQAQAQLNAGKPVEAFAIWDRELRLRRALGLLQETQALGRVGNIAWNENQPYQVQIITARLQQIQQEAQVKSPLDSPLMEALAQGYQQVRSPGLAINVYQLLLAEARQRNNAPRVEAILQTMGQLHLSWFDYPKAATTYQELLRIAQSSGNKATELTYLNQLAFTYEQGKQPDQAIPIQEKLISLYQKANNPQPIPLLKLKIADNYQRLNRADLAEKYYQEAFTLSQPQFQLAYASEALQKLGDLYKAVDRLDAALRVYGYLITVEQQSYNYYGMMTAYDEIGKIYLSRKAFPQAATAFQQGLILAKQLKYREDYFVTQLNQAQQGGQ